MDFKDQWTQEMALEVLGNETVDSRTWADAVKWLILYGPPGVRDVLIQAADTATGRYFPDLKPSRYTEDGRPCYDISSLADALDLSEHEVREQLEKLEEEQGVAHLVDPEETKDLQ